jgi:acetyltransferase-like isoleucine patch superfamily enzyme
MAFFLNPKRRKIRGLGARLIHYCKLPLIRLGLSLGFTNIEYSYVHGDPKRLKLGRNCSTMNTIFNTCSGNITIGDDTIISHNCMVLTGIHRFYKGRRAKLVPNSGHFRETPESGYDIEIGKGCYIGSGAMILGQVKIGDNVIVCAGAVVTKDVPSGCFVGGNPAKIISYHRIENE